MTVVWLTLVVALAIHEASHYGRLRVAGLHPRPSFHFPGLGWKFAVENATPHQLRNVWLVGPLAESIVWAGAALLFPAEAVYLVLLMVVELITNLLLPGSDGRRALRSLRASAGRPSSRAGPQHQVP
jgi:hypothetical protein